MKCNATKGFKDNYKQNQCGSGFDVIQKRFLLFKKTITMFCTVSGQLALKI